MTKVRFLLNFEFNWIIFYYLILFSVFFLLIWLSGFILVGDNGNGRIQIFRPNGNFVRSLGSKGSGPGQFNWISGLTLSKDRDIIATDFKNHCIQIF